MDLNREGFCIFHIIRDVPEEDILWNYFEKKPRFHSHTMLRDPKHNVSTRKTFKMLSPCLRQDFK